MASFLENLFPSSWRGVPFFIEDSRFTLGRRVVVHEFVQNDFPFVEDLGRDTRKQKVSGWIVANKDNDYNPWPQRDALIRAVEQGGDDVFVNPFYGEQKGHVTEFEVTETSTKGGGLIKFSFTFIESGNAQYNSAPRTKVVEAPEAEPAYSSIEDDFNTDFDIEGVAGFVRENAASTLDEFLAMTANLKIDVFNPAALTSALGINQTLAFVQGARNNLRQMVTGAVMTAAAISNGVLAIISTLDDIAHLDRWVNKYALPFNTRSRARERKNNAAMTNLIRSAAIVRKAEKAAILATPRYVTDDTVRGLPKLVTRQELQELRAEVSESLTAQIEDLSAQFVFDATQISLLKLRTETVAYMTEQGEHLARVFFTSTCDANVSQSITPSLVTAYRHYGELVDESIILRNDIAHPLFVSPHQTLELLALDNLDTFSAAV